MDEPIGFLRAIRVLTPVEVFMSRILNALLITAALSTSVALTAQDRHDQSAQVYQDTRHHDTHQWNSDEDQKYHAYLEEHHKKYRDFGKLSHKEQNNYWDWRHQH